MSHAASPARKAQCALCQPPPQPPGETATCSQAIDLTSQSLYRIASSRVRPTSASLWARVRVATAVVSAAIAGRRTAYSCSAKVNRLRMSVYRCLRSL